MTVQSRSVVVRLSAETAQYIREMQKAGKLGEDAMGKVGKRTKSSSDALDELGGKAGKVGLLAAAAFTGIAGAAANFDEAMSHVAATGEDARGSLEALRKEALEAGARTKFSATEAAQGVEALAKAGLSAHDTLAGGLNGALDLAASGQLAVADAAEITATALTQFQLEGNKATHVADLLAAGAGKAQGEVADMALALKYAGVPAANLGVSIEQTAGTIALLAKNGIIGEQAGTSLRGMLASLSSPSSAAAQEMGNLGISVFDAKGDFIGLDGVAGVLHDRLKNLTQQERANALGRIFGNEQLQAANVLYREGAEGVRLWTSEVDDAGYATESAGRKMDNLKGDLEQLMGSLETAFIGSGSGAQGPLRELTQGATDAVNAFNKLPGPVQSSATALLGITAVVGGGLWLGAKTVRGINDTREALAALNVDATKTKNVLGTLGKISILVGVASAVDDVQHALKNMADVDLSNLSTDLEIFGETGKVTGELTKGFGADLDGAAKNLHRDGMSIGQSLAYAAEGVDSWVEKLEGYNDSESVIRTKELDEALASLAGTNAPAAADAFDRLAEAAKKEGVSVDDLMVVFPEYSAELDRAKTLAEEASGATTGLADANRGSATAAADAAVQTELQAEALLKQRDAARETAAEFIGLGDSVDDTKVSLTGWITELEKQAAALRDFTANAQEAAEKGLRQGLIDALEEAGPAGALRMQQLADASDSEIDRANRAWGRGQRAMAEYVNFKVPAKKIEVETGDAIAKLNAFKELYYGIKNRKVTLTTNHVNSGDALTDLLGGPLYGGKDGDPRTPQALGGFYPRTYADGGIDVANGHQPEIAQAGAWRVWAEPETGGETYLPHANDYRRPMAKRYLEQTASLFGGEVAWYANGGTRGGGTFHRQGSSAAGGMGAGIDYDRLASAISHLRPVAEQMNVQPHNYNEFLRQMAQARRLAGADGVRTA